MQELGLEESTKLLIFLGQRHFTGNRDLRFFRGPLINCKQWERMRWDPAKMVITSWIDQRYYSWDTRFFRGPLTYQLQAMGKDALGPCQDGNHIVDWPKLLLMRYRHCMSTLSAFYRSDRYPQKTLLSLLCGGEGKVFWVEFSRHYLEGVYLSHRRLTNEWVFQVKWVWTAW